MNRLKPALPIILILLACNGAILYSPPAWSGLRLPAALALAFILPGWAWLPPLGWLRTDRAIERLMLLGGLSTLLAALFLLVALLLPGPFTEGPALAAINLAVLSGLLYRLLPGKPQPGGWQWPSRTVLLILVAIVAVAAFTRLARLGYAEFHEDELENMRLIVRAYKGEEYAPFLDSKGPIHWLLPAALWYMRGWLTEGLARAPFALASLLLIPAVYALGRRLSGGRAAVGLVAAGFVALNGFFVAYARHVENQSLIVFWGALAMWLAYRYYREDRPALLPWLALALAIGLIAHPDVLLYLPVFAYVIGLKVWTDRARWRQQAPWLGAAALLLVGLLALFYIPYLADPNIGLVYQYFEEQRVGTSLLYNRVPNLFDQDRLYTTRYHAPILVGLLFWLLVRRFGPWGRTILGGLTLLIVTSLAWPAAWIAGGVNLAFVPYALLALLVMGWLPASFEIKALFLWFSLPLGALLFLARDAADHIQVAYPAWALLAAFGLVDLWAYLARLRSRRLSLALRTGLALGLALAAGLILSYQYLTFDGRVTDYWQAKQEYTDNPNSIYTWLYGSIARPRKLFSNPRLGGWKVVGYLWESGQLSGDFRSINESFAVPIWYTFQTPRSCYNDPRHYWLRRDWQGWPDEEEDIIEQGYTLTRIVLVDGQPKLHLYEKEAAPQEPHILDLADYRRRFDRLATPARFAQGDEIFDRPTTFTFAGKLRLRGYHLPQAAVRPGELLPVSVYWESLAPMQVRYRGFVHLVGPEGGLWGQHDDDPACRLLTTDMRPGQHSSRQFRLAVDPATPPGQYRLLFGLYHPDTLERLPIQDETTGQPLGDSLLLGQVTVKAD